MAETELQREKPGSKQTNKSFNHFSTLDTVWSSAGGGSARVNVGSTFRLICTSGTRAVQGSDPRKLNYTAEANCESSTKQQHRIHLPSLGLAPQNSIASPHWLWHHKIASPSLTACLLWRAGAAPSRGQRVPAVLSAPCLRELTRRASFALMKLIRKGLGHGKCCCLFDLQLQIWDESDRVIPAQSKEWQGWMSAEGVCQQWFWAKRALLSQLDFPSCSH